MDFLNSAIENLVQIQRRSHPFSNRSQQTFLFCLLLQSQFGFFAMGDILKRAYQTNNIT